MFEEDVHLNEFGIDALDVLDAALRMPAGEERAIGISCALKLAEMSLDYPNELLDPEV